ncbi:NUDIX hydrolase [Tupanvirus deep ocean]|uniref:NUDIX hydrolase n=2 Tax=Tupanvirus TaxID=2094720 RepID=A0AC62A8M5_9VIRU|nr:NUDIX hydrolase [Tupanvirus deep ocean]QKU34131.1 NUDIX hydrolase [Tupanvirus deep ocean]
MTATVPHCAGIIVFKGEETVLVSTDRGNLSFPKGKRNKGETDIQTAWRETNEETGLTQDQIKLLDGVYFDEYTRKGNLSVRYFVGVLVKEHQKFKFDPTELANVAWYSVENACSFEKLKKERREILEKAYEVYKQI